MTGYVLVGCWPAAGKTTVATALAARLGLPYLAKDEVKEALTDALGAPSTVAASRALGVAAVHAVLRTARGCPGAVIDSTWYPYSLPLVRALAGPFVEVRCRVPVELARERYRGRARAPGRAAHRAGTVGAGGPAARRRAGHRGGHGAGRGHRRPGRRCPRGARRPHRRCAAASGRVLAVGAGCVSGKRGLCGAAGGVTPIYSVTSKVPGGNSTSVSSSVNAATLTPCGV